MDLKLSVTFCVAYGQPELQWLQVSRKFTGKSSARLLTSRPVAMLLVSEDKLVSSPNALTTSWDNKATA